MARRINPKYKEVKYSKRGNRFLTQYEMAYTKHVDAIYNARVKRGEMPKYNTGAHNICRCGAEGCIGFRAWDVKERSLNT
jgi:hypothetical protein